ncbi:unnamed protein product [Symbiodinium sp. CCMP2592]|nr:unnamed protein product [Symbiodinium sp. CCMP2592]
MHWCRCIFLVLDDPDNFLMGKVISAFVVATILLSTTSFILESMQSFAKRPDLCEALRAAGEPLTVEACEPASGPASAALGAACILVFTVEYLARLLTCHAEPVLGETPTLRVLHYARSRAEALSTSASAGPGGNLSLPPAILRAATLQQVVIHFQLFDFMHMARHRLLNLLCKAIWSVSQPRNLSEMFHRHEALLGSNDEKRVSFGDPYAWLSSRDTWQFCKARSSTVMINLWNRFFNVIVGIIFACVSWPAALLSSEYIAVCDGKRAASGFRGVKVMFFVPAQLRIFLATPHGLGKSQHCTSSLDACLANLHVFEVPAPFPTGVFVRIDAQDRPQLH